MGLRRILVLILGVIAAGATAIYANSILNRPAEFEPAVEATVEPSERYHILVAATDLPSGRFIKEEDLRWQEWPTDDVPETYALQGRQTLESMMGGVVRRGISAGQPIIAGNVVTPGDRGFLAAVLSPGTRAVSVPINATSGNSGLIFPGDRVDLILTQTLESTDESITRRVSETVLENIRVIAMGVDTSDETGEGLNYENARTATLEVTPHQAEVVTLVTELGKLSLSLRSLSDDQEGEQVVEERIAPTWDADVSSVLRSGGQPKSGLLVLRGGETENVAAEGQD